MPSMLRILIFFTVLFSASGLCAGETSKIRIALQNMSPEFDLYPYVETFSDGFKSFVKSETEYTYEYDLSPELWFNTVDIKLIWKKADIRGAGRATDFEQRLTLRLRPNSNREITIPVLFSNDRSQNEMLRLERLASINEQFRVYFRGNQIASYYREVLGPLHPFTRRAALIFFNSAVRLAQQQDAIIALNEDAISYILEVYPDSITYQNRIAEARSVYWFDLNGLDSLITKGRCAEASRLIQDLEKRKAEDAVSYFLRFSKSERDFDQKKEIFKGKCVSPQLIPS